MGKRFIKFGDCIIQKDEIMFLEKNIKLLDGNISTDIFIKDKVSDRSRREYYKNEEERDRRFEELYKELNGEEQYKVCTTDVEYDKKKALESNFTEEEQNEVLIDEIVKTYEIANEGIRSIEGLEYIIDDMTMDKWRGRIPIAYNQPMTVGKYKVYRSKDDGNYLAKKLTNVEYNEALIDEIFKVYERDNVEGADLTVVGIEGDDLNKWRGSLPCRGERFSVGKYTVTRSTVNGHYFAERKDAYI